MRKSKQSKHKRLFGTNLKVNPLKKFKKQIKRMTHRLKDENLPTEKKMIYKSRLLGAEQQMKNWEKNQEAKKQANLQKKAQGK